MALAKKVSKSKQMISFYESGRNLPTLEVLKRIAKVFGTTVVDILKDVESEGDWQEYIRLKLQYGNDIELKDTPAHPVLKALDYERQPSGKLAVNTSQEVVNEHLVDKSYSQVARHSNVEWTNDEKEGIPFYDVDVFAGNVEAYNDGPQTPSGYLRLPGAWDCDFSCRVSGESMIRKILPGAIIACKEIKNKDLIQFGDIFLIITAENRWVKIVRKHTDPAYFLLKSQNPEYDDIDCPKSEVLRLFTVKMIVNQEHL